jgi:O-antigen/teichoic acid export membrane protein
MLLSYMLLGMLFNVSMWYKLSGKTNMAIWITLAGLVVTAVVNMVFMPRFSYWASAFGHLASYLVMFILSAWLGSKYYPIPYNWKRILAIFGLMGLAYAGIYFCDLRADALAIRLLVNTALIGTYGAMSWLLLRSRRAVDVTNDKPTD